MDMMTMLSLSPAGIIDTVIPTRGLTVACGTNYFAATHRRRTDIGLWRLPVENDDDALGFNKIQGKLPQWPLLKKTPSHLLCGQHNGAIKALAFNKDHQLHRGINIHRRPNNQTKINHPRCLLCSVDDERFVVWDLSQCIVDHEKGLDFEDKDISLINDKLIRMSGSLVSTKETEDNAIEEMVSYCCFSWDDLCIAICRGKKIFLIFLSIKWDKQVEVLNGHDSFVNSAEFSPHHPTWLVSLSDDRTFIVWDIMSGSHRNILQRSYIPGPLSVPLIVAMDFIRDYVSIATVDGKLFLFDLSSVFSPTPSHKEHITTIEHSTFPLLRSLDCSKLSKNKEYSKAVPTDPNSVNSECVLLWVSYVYSSFHLPKENSLNSPENFFENLNRSLFLLVGTNMSIFCLDSLTLECVAFVDLLFYPSLMGDFKTLSVMAMAQQFETLAINCATANYFNNAIHISKLSLPKLNFSKSYKSSDSGLNPKNHLVCPSSKLEPNSILKLVHETCLLTNNTQSKLNCSTIKEKGEKNQPLTFKSKVKSSGYSVEPTHSTLFKPNTKISKKSCTKSKFIARTLPQHYNPLQVIHYKCCQRITDNITTAITNITFSSDGQNLAAAFTDGTAMIMKNSNYHFLDKKPSIFMGCHRNALNSVSLSHNGRWLLTASNDKTATIWDKQTTKVLITFDKIKHNSNKYFSGKNQTGCFEKEIKAAQFYYLDNFILLASGPKFYLYNYHMDTTREDIKSYLTKSQYKLVQEFEIDGNIVADLAAINSFYSYIVVCCTSSRSLCAYDMNVGKRILTIEDAHPIPAHSIVMNAASKSFSLPASGYDIVLTAAAMNSIKIWDLRSAQNVRQFNQHVNGSHRCTPSFSPCGKYVLAASENNTAYLYDIGQGASCEQFLRHSDVVTNVAYNPILPQVLTATLDGKLYSFSNNENPE